MRRNFLFRAARGFSRISTSTNGFGWEKIGNIDPACRLLLTTQRMSSVPTQLGDSSPKLKSSTPRDDTESYYFDESITDEEWRQKTKELLSLDEGSGSLTARDVIACEQSIRYWTKQRSQESVDLSFKLFGLLTRCLQEQPVLLESRDLLHFFTGNFPRATHLLNAILDAWRIQLERGGAEVRNGFTFLVDPHQMLDTVTLLEGRGVPLDCRTFSLIMQASLLDDYFNPKETPVFCEKLLSRMLKEPRTLPDTVAFTTAIHAWGKSNRPNSPHRAEQLYQEYTHLYHNNLIHDSPNTVTYNTVLDALCRGKESGMVQRAYDIFCDMRTSPYPNVTPDTVSYRIMINGWASIGHLEEAGALLNEMVELYLNGNTDLQVDATFFSKLISTLAKSKDNRKHIQACELYQSLQQLYQDTQDIRFHPDELFTTRAMIIVYSKLGQPELAEGLLQRLEKQALREKFKRSVLMPKRGHYRDVLFAWVKSESKDAAERAERILLRMLGVLEPEKSLIDQHTLDNILRLWARQSKNGQNDAAKRGEELLRAIVAFNLDNNTAVCKVGRSSYLQVMKGWLYSQDPDAANRIEKLLVDLKNLAAEDGSMMPTRVHFTVAANAWLKRKGRESPVRILRLLEAAHNVDRKGFQDARPDRTLYGTLINSYAYLGDAKRADEVWRKMLEESATGNSLITPTIAELNLVLLAYLRSRQDPKETSGRIEKLLHDATTQLGLSPNQRTMQLLGELKL